MEPSGKYRHELKYPIGMADYLTIRQRLRAVMKSDPHTGPDGTYFIRSIYFDNADDKALREKVNGVQKREKFRIRYYNDDLSYLSLEKKLKYNDLCMKAEAPISEELCRAILRGDLAAMPEDSPELVKELACKMVCQRLKPRVLVSYLREPYIFAAGNVRVTFDSHIRSSLYHTEFLEDTVQDIPATDLPGDMLMEVKYDAFLPDVIAELLQTGTLRVQAFSKYGICRRFG